MQQLLTRKHKNQIIFGILVLMSLSVMVAQVQAADGTSGSISTTSQLFHISGSIINIKCYNMDAGADYKLNWTGEATGISFTLANDQTSYTHTMSLTSSSNVIFYLYPQSTGSALDQVQVTVLSMTTFLNTTLIIAAGIFILILVVFKRVAKG